MTKSQQLEPVLPAIPYIYDYGSGPVLCWQDPYLTWPAGGGVLASNQEEADQVIRDRTMRRRCIFNRLKLLEEDHADAIRHDRRRERLR